MLNRQSSSKTKNEKNKKAPRSPLQDLNGIAGSNCGRSTCSVSSSCSSSMSVEVSRGCLRFLLPSSSTAKTPFPRSKAKATPKSAPHGKPSNPSFSSRSTKSLKENVAKPKLVKEKLKKPPHYLCQLQYGKKPNSKTAPKPKPSTGTSGSLGDNLAFVSKQFTSKKCDVPMDDESGESPKLLKLPDLSTVVENCTPDGKVECGSGFTYDFDCNPVEEDCTPNTAIKTKTPPVQTSLSPEIPCGPSMPAATPACYGAGHIVSGVTDRRKCRSKGVLTVGETDNISAKAYFFDNTEPRASLVPLPSEASMRWLLSPCDKEDEYQKSDLKNGMHCLQKSFGSNNLQCLSSPSSGQGIAYKDFENNSSTSASSSRRTTRITLLSPSGSPAYHVAPTCEALISNEKRKHRYDLAREDSPFSVDSLGSGNIIQTPESDLSPDRHIRFSWLNSHFRQNQDLGSGIDSLEEVLLRASLSPKTQISIQDPPGLNFQISDLISPYNSIDLVQFTRTWDNHASCASNSSLDDMSKSHMRISWRDGLVSRIFEMDEFDCCRCLSDDENDAIECSDGKFQCSPNHELNVDLGSVAVHSNCVHSNCFRSPDIVGHEPKTDGEPKEKFPEQRSNPCVESICTDASGLFASADSDWTFSCKNQLFEL